jgi:hypothetical protein
MDSVLPPATAEQGERWSFMVMAGGVRRGMARVDRRGSPIKKAQDAAPDSAAQADSNPGQSHRCGCSGAREMGFSMPAGGVVTCRGTRTARRCKAT